MNSNIFSEKEIQETIKQKSYVNEGWFTSKLQEWETPQAFFEALNIKFKFNIDVCANPHNAKCEYYFTKEIDGLKQDWIHHSKQKGRIFMNPPFREVGLWFRKTIEELQKGNCEIVISLTPSRSTEASYFQEIVLRFAHEIWFLTPRVKYVNPFEPEKKAPPFGSMNCIFYAKQRATPFPILKGINWKQLSKNILNSELTDFLEVKT